MELLTSTVTAIADLMGTFFTFIFNGNHAPFAVIAFLPIVAFAVGLVSKFIHHKHKA